MKALLLPLGGDVYALPFADVVEVIPMPAVTVVPGSPSGVLGLLNLRGQVVPLLDTARLLGLPSAARATFVAVVESAQGAAALTVTGLPWAADLGEPANPAESTAAIAVFEVEQLAVTLLDVEVLLGALRAEQAVG